MKTKDDQTRKFIFIGGGCASLSLILRWIDDLGVNGSDILVIEADPNSARERTWCEWTASTRSDRFADLESASWSSGTFYSGKETSENLFPEKPLPLVFLPYRYRMIQGSDFHERITRKLKSHGVDFHVAEVRSINKETGEVITSDGLNFKANLIFNSVPALSSFQKGRYNCVQSFLGWKIRTKRPLFDPSTVNFMDFRTKQERGVSFVYTLPFSATEALVEFTVFSKATLELEYYEHQLKVYLHTILKLADGDFELIEPEFGQIPMSDALFQMQEGKRVFHIGSAAGLVKPSTGYTFDRIQRDSHLMSSSFDQLTQIPLSENVGTIQVNRYRTSKRFRFYDQLFLNILVEDPKSMPKIFESLFRKTSAKKVFDFLSEDTTVLEEIAIFWKLPWLPFLKAVYRHSLL
jgi:lycopene beta-cyclase